MQLQDSSWIFLSLSLAVITSLGALTLKYIGMNYSKDRDTSIIIGLMCAVLAGFFSFLILCYHNKKVKQICLEIHNDYRTIEYAIFFTAIIFVLNVCLTIYTLSKVENPAYAQIIKNTNVVFILLLSILIFKSKFDKKCALGVLITLFGIGMIIYYNSQ